MNGNGDGGADLVARVVVDRRDFDAVDSIVGCRKSGIVAEVSARTSRRGMGRNGEKQSMGLLLWFYISCSDVGIG